MGGADSWWLGVRRVSVGLPPHGAGLTTNATLDDYIERDYPRTGRG